MSKYDTVRQLVEDLTDYAIENGWDTEVRLYVGGEQEYRISSVGFNSSENLIKVIALTQHSKTAGIVDKKDVTCTCAFLGEHRVSSRGCPIHETRDISPGEVTR